MGLDGDVLGRGRDEGCCSACTMPGRLEHTGLPQACMWDSDRNADSHPLTKAVEVVSSRGGRRRWTETVIDAKGKGDHYNLAYPEARAAVSLYDWMPERETMGKG